jgi:hypothetical protein
MNEPFALSIASLSLVQAVLIAVPARTSVEVPAWTLNSRWALIPSSSIAVVIGGIAILPALAEGLTYLALLAVPPLAALALARFTRGARPELALAVPPLFAVAWIFAGTLGGEAAALVLSALACVSLGTILVAITPPAWLRLGVYAMALLDTVLVAADLLQQPNSVLANAAPAGGLPQLQAVMFGHAQMGFGDLFVAATVGALLATELRSRRSAVILAAGLGLSFDLLFFVVNELPATVPIAVTLALVEGQLKPASEVRRLRRSPA